MFSKQLFTTLSLLALVASSALAAPPLQCPAPSTVTVVASPSSVAAASSVAVSSAAASATSVSSKGNKDKNGKGHDDKGHQGKDKNGKGKSGDNGATSSSAAASSDAAATSSASLTESIAASNSAVSSSVFSSAASTATATLGGDKGVGGTGLGSSAIANSTASATAASSSATSGTATTDDQQSATTLNPAVIATGFASDGQEVPAVGQVPSLTSTNNFINFCLTVNKPITNGQQIKTGSCNPAPMGIIAATTNMPSSKFQFPKNGDTVPAKQAFTIKMGINNLETGNFVNAASNYYSAPQQVNGQGNIIGHSHVVIEQLTSLDQTTPNDPTKFAFFKGINGAAVDGAVTADVTDGLPAGFYRMASINAAANHQPVLVAVAQHGSLDDMVYFTVQ